LGADARRLRIAYYTRPAFLDHSLSLVRAVSGWAQLHLLLEVSPEERAAGLFGEAGLSAPAGVTPADGAVSRGYLAGARSFLSDLASFDLVVHANRRAFAPGALGVSVAAARRVRTLRPQLVHFEDVTPRSAPLFFLTPGTPKLVTIHDPSTHLGERVGRAELVRKIALGRASRLLFHSRYARHQLVRPSAGMPTSVVPLGIPEVFREWPGVDSPEQERTLLFFGRLSPYKGLPVLYQALPLIAQQVPRLRVVVAGRPVAGFHPPAPPPLPPDVDLVTHLGFVDLATQRRLFQSATLVVLPYLQASQSGVAQTAYAFGKPVIASAVGGLPEDVGDGQTGRLVPPGDPRALAQAAVELLLDAELRARLRANIARREAAELGWRAITPRLQAIYAATAAARPCPQTGSACA
jgi:glycosyltransferase involved in cell wall biosynthesis